MAFTPPRPSKAKLSGRQFSTGGDEVIRMSVAGLDGVVANLHSAYASVKEGCQAATRRMAADTANLARQLVPVDTGRTQRSITERLSDEDLAFEVFCDPDAFAADGQPYYAPHLEYGTVFMEARPFLEPAAREMWPSYTEDLKAAIRRGMTPTTTTSKP